MLRPALKIPLWAAAAIPVAAYLGRSAITGSFALSTADVVVASALGLGLLLAARYGSTAQRRRDELSGKMHDGDGDERDPGKDHEV